jgi:hypothetical protein
MESKGRKQLIRLSWRWNMGMKSFNRTVTKVSNRSRKWNKKSGFLLGNMPRKLSLVPNKDWV